MRLRFQSLSLLLWVWIVVDLLFQHFSQILRKTGYFSHHLSHGCKGRKGLVEQGGEGRSSPNKAAAMAQRKIRAMNFRFMWFTQNT